MKLCTVFNVLENDELEAVEWSLVSDDHEFGIIDGQLHLEGQILSVTLNTASDNEVELTIRRDEED